MPRETGEGKAITKTTDIWYIDGNTLSTIRARRSPAGSFVTIRTNGDAVCLLSSRYIEEVIETDAFTTDSDALTAVSGAPESIYLQIDLLCLRLFSRIRFVGPPDSDLFILDVG